MSVSHAWKPGPARPRLETFTGRLIGLWQAAPLSTPLRISAFAAVFVALGVLRLIFAAFPQNAYSHDPFIFLDGAWRVLNGQRPQVDFNSNLGPVMYLFTAAGLQLTHTALHAVATAQVLLSGMIALLVAFVAFRRMPQIPAMLVTLTAVLIAICPCNTGEEPFGLTYAMIYNRVGFGLLVGILVEATQRPLPKHERTREELIGGFLSGLVAAFLFFLKITYGIMAVVLLIGLLPYRSQIQQRFIGLLGGVLAVSLAVFAYLGFHFRSVFDTLVLAGSAKHLLPDVITSRVVTYSPLIIIMAILAALSVLLTNTSERVDVKYALRRAWAVAFVSVVALGLLLSNAQLEGLPLAAVMCLIVASEMVGMFALLGSREDREGISPAACLLVFAAMLIPVANVLFWDSGAFAFSIVRALGIHSAGERTLASPVATDFKTKQVFTMGLDLEPYTEYVNDGLRLLEANSSQNESIVTLDFVNPFPFLLQRRPASHGTTCLHYLTTFDDVHHLTPDELLGNASLVMWPKHFEEPRLGRGIEKVYGDAVREKYTLVAESTLWRLMRRNAGVNVSQAR